MIPEIYKRFISSTGISTDTRKITSGNLFFALKGPHFDANKFARKALDSGASYAVIDDSSCAFDERCIVVNNTLTTLQGLANYHRKQLKIPIIGITGSNGSILSECRFYFSHFCSINLMPDCFIFIKSYCRSSFCNRDCCFYFSSFINSGNILPENIKMVFKK